MSVLLAWSLLARSRLPISLSSSSLSSKTSTSWPVCLGCRKACILLSVLIFCSNANLVFTVFRLSRGRGIDTKLGRIEEGRKAEQGCVWQGWKGGREGIQKSRRDSREERPMILTTKWQTLPQWTNRQNNVCNFNIEFFGPFCPPYNIQNSNFPSGYREKYPLFWQRMPYWENIWIFTITNFKPLCFLS